MFEGDWDNCFTNSNNASNYREGRGRGGRGGGNRGRGGNRSNDFDSPSVDGWSNGGGEDNEQEGSSRGRGGRGGRGRGRGGGRYSDNANNADRNNGDFNGGDDQPPVSDKPRPTYIPPEIDDNDFNSVEVGTNFDKYQNIEVKVSGDSVPKHIESFKSSGLREVLIEKLARCNYTTPTPIQKYSIPVIINGRDMMASAQTGSGKTVSVWNNLNLK